jgi:hypothetical protein
MLVKARSVITQVAVPASGYIYDLKRAWQMGMVRVRFLCPRCSTGGQCKREERDGRIEAEDLIFSVVADG